MDSGKKLNDGGILSQVAVFALELGARHIFYSTTENRLYRRRVSNLVLGSIRALKIYIKYKWRRAFSPRRVWAIVLNFGAARAIEVYDARICASFATGFWRPDRGICADVRIRGYIELSISEAFLSSAKFRICLPIALVLFRMCHLNVFRRQVGIGGDIYSASILAPAIDSGPPVAQRS